MDEYLALVGLTVTAMLALLFYVSAIQGIIRGRVKIEPSQPWVVFREHPVKFAGCVLWYLYFASCFAMASWAIASSLLR